jgi:hypothetical protein
MKRIAKEGGRRGFALIARHTRSSTYLLPRIRATLAWLTLASPVALGLFGIVSFLAWVLQAGMSERVYTTRSQANYWDYLIGGQTPGSAIFRAAVSWLPGQSLTADPYTSFPLTIVEYLGVVALLFVLYAMALHWLARHPTPDAARCGVAIVIGGAGVLFSALLLLSPSAPSHDPIAYGSGGQILGTYRANPYFVLPAAFPHDSLLAANEWQQSAEAYGPLWTVLSTLLSPLVAGDPLRSNMIYRVVAFLAHIANMLLLVAMPSTLPAWHRAWRERGLLLYAWNPLVVLQVAAGHNDVVMLTLLLLGVYAIGRSRHYLAAMCLGASLLVKASAAPVVLVTLLGLWMFARPAARHLAPARVLTTAGTLAGVVCAGYVPFLWGHSLQAIAQASRSQPTAQSLARALAARYAVLPHQIMALHLVPHPLTAALAYLAASLASPQLWTVLIAASVLAVAFFVLPPIRGRLGELPPALAAVYAVPLVFLSVFDLLQDWYVVPLVGLACLAPGGRATRRFTLALTATLQIETLFLVPALSSGGQIPFLPAWLTWKWALVMGIPLAVLAVSLRPIGPHWQSWQVWARLKVWAHDRAPLYRFVWGRHHLIRES